MNARASRHPLAAGEIELTLRLSADRAAALKRFAEKIGHSEAQAVLYPHVSAGIRSQQAHQTVAAFAELERALADAGARSWPWIETGSAS